MYRYLIFIFCFTTYAVDISYYSCGSNQVIKENVELEGLVPFCAKELKINDFCRCHEKFKDHKVTKKKAQKDYNKFIAKQYKKNMMKALSSIASDLSMLSAKYQFADSSTTEKFTHECSINNLKNIS